jgi:hypothetical protein
LQAALKTVAVLAIAMSVISQASSYANAQQTRWQW